MTRGEVVEDLVPVDVIVGEFIWSEADEVEELDWALEPRADVTAATLEHVATGSVLLPSPYLMRQYSLLRSSCSSNSAGMAVSFFIGRFADSRISGTHASTCNTRTQDRPPLVEVHV